MNFISIAAASILVLASLNEAAPAATKRFGGNQLPGLSNIKHVVYFMQVRATYYSFFSSYTL
jgi:phospholipase C